MINTYGKMHIAHSHRLEWEPCHASANGSTSAGANAMGPHSERDKGLERSTVARDGRRATSPAPKAAAQESGRGERAPMPQRTVASGRHRPPPVTRRRPDRESALGSSLL